MAQDGEIDGLFERSAQLTVLDHRSPEEIVGYGSDGLPR